jgi:hypothetical protein
MQNHPPQGQDDGYLQQSQAQAAARMKSRIAHRAEHKVNCLMLFALCSMPYF